MLSEGHNTADLMSNEKMCCTFNFSLEVLIVVQFLFYTNQINVFIVVFPM